MPGFLSLVRRRWQVLVSSNTAQEQLDAAEALVLQSRQKATLAKNRLEEHRGVGSLPNAENRQSADIELIAALDQYDQIRRTVEVPLEEAIHLWKQGEEARRETRSRSNVFRSIFMLSVRSMFFQQLLVAEAGLKATTSILDSRLTKSLLAKAASRTSTPNESLLRYRHNNASFIASLERLHIQLDPLSGSITRGLEGGLPAGIAWPVNGFETVRHSEQPV